MIKNRWTHRVIVVLDAFVLGFIVDFLTGFPLWGMSTGTIACIYGLWRLENPGVLRRIFKLDSEIAAIMRAVILALTFFVECAVLAWLITM